MTVLNRRVFVGGSVAALTMLKAEASLSSTGRLPSGTLRMLVGFPAGGGADGVGRLIVEKIRQRTGRALIVENKGGASGMIAAGELKMAAPNGETIMFAPSATLMAQLASNSTAFDPATDFAPLGLAGLVQVVFAVSATLGVNSFAEYLDWLKRNPEKPQFGTTALGSSTHFAAVLLGKAAKVDLEPVPYKGGAPLIADLIAGHLPAGCGGLSEMLEHHRSGKIRILCSFGNRRMPTAADIPLAKELGYEGVVFEGWYGFFAPIRVTKEIVDGWNAEISAAVEDSELRQRLLDRGIDPQSSTPDAFGERMRIDAKKWREIIAVSGYKPN